MQRYPQIANLSFSIDGLRVIRRGYLFAAFTLKIPGASIEAELFGRDDGTAWIDARSVKDASGEYRRTVKLDRALRDLVCTRALEAFTAAVRHADDRRDPI